jgi:hypothetical protein
MRLIDARKLAIRRQTEIRFPLPNGVDCIVDRHGIARVPGLKGPLDFSLEEAFARAERVLVGQSELSRAELEKLTKSAPEPAAAAAEE